MVFSHEYKHNKDNTSKIHHIATVVHSDDRNVVGLVQASNSIILLPIHSATCGTTALPNPLSLSTREGTLVAILGTAGHSLHHGPRQAPIETQSFSSSVRDCHVSETDCCGFRNNLIDVLASRRLDINLAASTASSPSANGVWCDKTRIRFGYCRESCSVNSRPCGECLDCAWFHTSRRSCHVASVHDTDSHPSLAFIPPSNFWESPSDALQTSGSVDHHETPLASPRENPHRRSCCFLASATSSLLC